MVKIIDYISVEDMKSLLNKFSNKQLIALCNGVTISPSIVVMRQDDDFYYCVDTNEGTQYKLKRIKI
jgi:hypothetical protein